MKTQEINHMGTNGINLAELARSVTPGAVIGTSRSGVSMVDLLSQGVSKDWIELQLGLGTKMTELPTLWMEFQRKVNAKTMQAAPPTAAKIASDATKRTFSVPYQATTVPENETPEQELARLRAENERLKGTKTANRLSCKVSEKGALSVYGIGRFPVTLYRGQWERLLAVSDDIKSFINDHAASLAVKE